MKSDFHAGGELEYGRGKNELTEEFMKKRYAEVENKYAELIAVAKPEQKEQIYQRMAEELARINHKPSVYTLW